MPEVTEIRYDLSVLRVTLDFASGDDPVCVEFRGVRGFRVLDEGDLLEFWDPETRPAGWIWKVHGGGWRDLETSRSGFLSGDRDYAEFLVLGNDDCVSVFAEAEPSLRSRERE